MATATTRVKIIKIQAFFLFIFSKIKVLGVGFQVSGPWLLAGSQKREDRSE
jgi:hypothetical protein